VVSTQSTTRYRKGVFFFFFFFVKECIFHNTTHKGDRGDENKEDFHAQISDLILDPRHDRVQTCGSSNVD
jgi:hypothetical protein